MPQMSEARVAAARLEAALARIARVAARPREQSDVASGSDPEAERRQRERQHELAARLDALIAQVREALTGRT